MKIVFSTGAGISVAAGLPTYRGAEGRYTEGSPNFLPPFEMTNKTTFADLAKACDQVRDLRPSVEAVQPTLAHQLIAQLESEHEVTVITQNIDDLHNKAGSTNVIELHGNIFKEYWSDAFEYQRVEITFFGEQLNPGKIDAAWTAVEEADYCIFIGTSGIVYPAASLMEFAFEQAWLRPSTYRTAVIDPAEPEVRMNKYVQHITKPADEGIQDLIEAFKVDIINTI